MRFIKVLFLILLFVVSMVFFVQNTETLSQGIQLKLDFKYVEYYSVKLPEYLLILGAFALGGLLTLVYFLIDKIRTSRQLKHCRSQLDALQQELNSLRNLPLESQGYGAGDEEEGH